MWTVWLATSRGIGRENRQRGRPETLDSIEPVTSAAHLGVQVMRTFFRPASWSVLGGLVVGSLAPAVVADAAADVTVTPKQSGCLDSDGTEEYAGVVSVEVEGCAVIVHHTGVVTNCCLEYDTKVSFDGATLELREVDLGPPCDCICPFDLEARIEGLEPGRYALVVHAFNHPEPLTFSIDIPPCTGFWLIGSEVWSPFGIEGVVVPILATNERPIEGFSFGVTFPLAHARMAEIDIRGTVTEEVGVDVLVVDIFNGPPEGGDPQDGDPQAGADEPGWATCSAIVDLAPTAEGRTIPPGGGQRLVNLVYDILPPSGSIPRSISVPLVGGLGNPQVPLVFTVEGQDVVPETRGGIIQLTMQPAFIRGDANDDGGISISDPIFLLNALFRGGPAPPCEDAADANDDGAIDIADAVSILLYQFAGGAIPPPSPPGPAGPDPTMDPLGCVRGG